MKVSTEKTIVKKNWESYLMMIEATEQLKEVSELAEARKSWERGFLVTQTEILVYVDESGEVDEQLLKLIDKNHELIAKYANIVNFDEKVKITEESQIKAIIYIVENITEEWSQSPYSESFYSAKNIDWGYKPEGSLRVSDHWDFGSDGEHCPTVEKVKGWAVCEFKNGIYHLVEKF
ncbi:TPA: hypothetical protein U3R06_001047 [Streptococcus agalactiae]|uniref:hypothetical protein n=1 Tax=Streptococcus agalactiae TaxID=1311 RepID=UPI001CCD7928|nr:hypothetical protein [Streptococcus agalactiae]HEN0239740.1 hypothetical protein [Streptococcus agalactiae]HEN0419965.1 hypothetical protein [Streptococcus agalactiae]HEN0428086.1 hypothetical protein [Streptococcus agalactiae]HEN0442981.1 hypothetical protein [Streptococcus agalactiae]HEN0451252.1 hypothetical protein [Streptococcus agalactiae]